MNLLERLKRLGPGLVTGAADDDPFGIAIYSQAGAQFGTSLMWTMLFAFPLMVAVQLASARIDRVTGRGLGRSLREVMPSWLVMEERMSHYPGGQSDGPFPPMHVIGAEEAGLFSARQAYLIAMGRH